MAACRSSARIRVALQPLEVSADIGSVLVAQVAVLLQGLLDDLFQLGGDLRVQAHRRHRGAVQDGLEDHRRGIATERHDAGSHLVEIPTTAPDG